MAPDPDPWPKGRPLRLATRGSPLARTQAGLVASALVRACPGLVVEVVVVQTRGDRLADVPLDRIGGQGVFVKEVQAAVLDGRADVAVHSAKDLPSTSPDELVIGAVPPRADPRDALVGSRLADLVPGALVATGSARRRAQLANLRPDLTFVELRGNMATRFARATDGTVHAVVVAQAALERLGRTDLATEVLSPALLLPQAGQGALALECRRDGGPLALLAAADDEASHRALDAERALLAAVGGSCAEPIGAWAEPMPTPGKGAGHATTGPGKGAGHAEIRLHAMVASADGRVLVRARRCGDEPVPLGSALAAQLLGECGGSAVTGPARWQGPPSAGPRA